MRSYIVLPASKQQLQTSTCMYNYCCVRAHGAASIECLVAVRGNDATTTDGKKRKLSSYHLKSEVKKHKTCKCK